MANDYLNDTLHEFGLITKKVQAEFGKLSEAQLNWKPTADAWSVGQCLDHLIKTNRQYYPILEEISQGHKKNTFWEYIPILPRLWGRLMLKSLDPGSTRKLKAPAVFRPGNDKVPGSIVSNFVQHQQDFIRLIKATDHVNHEETIITSPASAFITYSLKDCINICAVHEERHFLQAKRLLQQQDFPVNAAGQRIQET